jgi:hypothetical protein
LWRNGAAADLFLIEGDSSRPAQSLSCAARHRSRGRGVEARPPFWRAVRGCVAPGPAGAVPGEPRRLAGPGRAGQGRSRDRRRVGWNATRTIIPVPVRRTRPVPTVGGNAQTGRISPHRSPSPPPAFLTAPLHMLRLALLSGLSDRCGEWDEGLGSGGAWVSIQSVVRSDDPPPAS